ncbi:hypothetical protein FLP10_12030 [Agromyces intestinalis]|uniref:Uncharacterized protein n=1 Tax=Agromyces intestinalis TaxID=2592652 RepID=A0A5C1YGD4_9MICO|nr:hypothetical protein [Agromyces intestinalis]QEO15063.1 hypothetical protein FLP10_12030 [Agromyces intestinalis]
MSFRTRHLREFCIHPQVDALGPDDVIDLQARLAELLAADTLGEIPIGVKVFPEDPAKVCVEINERWHLLARLMQLQSNGATDDGVGLDQYRIRLDELKPTEEA